MLTADRISVPLTDGRLPISRELFANDAVMTEGLPFRTATIASTKNRRRVTMDFTDFDYFAVWSPYKDFEVPSASSRGAPCRTAITLTMPSSTSRVSANCTRTKAKP